MNNILFPISGGTYHHIDGKLVKDDAIVRAVVPNEPSTDTAEKTSSAEAFDSPQPRRKRKLEE